MTTAVQDLDPDDVVDGYHRLSLDRLSDRQLVDAVSTCLARPKVAPADSFVLHAPLELLARAQLLDLVPAPERERARVSLAALGASYARAGDELAEPPLLDAPVTTLGERLEHAATAGELDEVDRCAASLAARATADELRRALAPWVVASLAAAAHASIALNLLGRSGAASAVSPAVLRGLLRELARHPSWRLHWFEDPTEPVDTPVALREALLDVPVLGVPGSSFIYPLMHQAEESGLARSLLAGLAGEEATLPEVTRDLQRVAAWSMLQEGPEHAAYGWSHCLTMPQAVLAVGAAGAAPAPTAIAVAATHVVGFRTALSNGPIAASWSPAPPRTRNLDEALAAGPEEAAAWAWADAQQGGAGTLVPRLAAKASEHPDAHLVKYTLACVDAARADPAATHLYLAAAASLRGWWTQHDQA